MGITVCLQKRHNIHNRIAFHTDKDHIGDSFIVICHHRMYRNGEITKMRCFHFNAVLLHLFQMLSSCDHCHVFSCSCQICSDASAAATCSYYYIIHSDCPFFLLLYFPFILYAFTHFPVCCDVAYQTIPIYPHNFRRLPCTGHPAQDSSDSRSCHR